MTVTTSDALGGYRLTGLKSHGRDGKSFTATITRDGRAVLRVSNDGTGGSHLYGALGPSRPSAAFLTELAELAAFAKQWNAGARYAGFEDADALVERLITVHGLDRQKKTPFVFAGAGDFFVTACNGSSRA